MIAYFDKEVESKMTLIVTFWWYKILFQVLLKTDIGIVAILVVFMWAIWWLGAIWVAVFVFYLRH
jgi:hypothetical protein